MRLQAVLILASGYLLLSAQLAQAQSTETVPVYLGPQTQTLLGATKVVFVGINPVRYSAQLPAANVVLSNAPAPAFLPSSGGVNKAGPQAVVVSKFCNFSSSNVSDVSDAIATTNGYISILAQTVDSLIVVHREGFANPNLAEEASSKLVKDINDDPAFNNAAVCLSKLEGLDLSQATSDQKAAISNLVAAYPFLAGQPPARVGLADVEREQTVSCNGLLGGSSTSTLTLTLAPRIAQLGQSSNNQVTTITVKCLGQVAVSAGFVFSSLSQTAWDAVPIPTGNSMPPTMATIQETSEATIHAIPFAFAHVAPDPGCNASESCLFITFGAGVTSSSSSTANNIDFAVGITQSFSRYMYLTGGLNLGQQSVLASGYTVGSPIAVGAKVPTATVQRTGYFLGISFGARP